ncbi:MAG: apolipoprotein N-acyltransferase [Candidatus Kapaibacterium sp.]
MKKNTRIILSIATGLLLVLAFPPMPFYFLGFISFIPLLYLLDNTKKFYFWNTYATFFIYQIGTLWWISSFQEKTDPFLMASGFVLDVFHPFYFMIPIILWLVIRIRMPRRLSLYLFPFIWTTFEWSRSLTEFSFPWISVGYTQVYNTNWVQIADLFGVYGTAFVIVLVNVIIYDLICNYRNGESTFENNKWQYSSLVMLIILPIIYSNIQLTKYNHESLLKSNETVNIGLIQPNIDPWDKWSAGPEDQVLTLIDYSNKLLDSVPDLDLVIWPETSILYLDNNFNLDHNFGFLKSWVDTSNISLLTGFVDIVVYESDAPSITKQMYFGGKNVKYDNFNSALLLDSNEYDIYHKMKLTPFGERVPHVEILTFLTEFIDWGVGISFWGKGTEQKSLKVPNTNVSLAPIICIESIHPTFVKEFSKKGANLFTVITNDAWYDFTTGPEQHALISAFRAIENKRYVARAANSGVTCFISPTGRILHRAEQYKQSSIAMTIPTIEEATFYSIYGDWLSYFCILTSIFFVFYSIFKNK